MAAAQEWRGWLAAHAGRLLLVISVAALAAGGLLWLVGRPGAAACWAVGATVALLPAAAWAVAGLRRGQLGADVLAVLALAGTLLVGEYLAGAVIGVMLATGRMLDDYAQRRAHRDLGALLERAPRTARLRDGDEVRIVPVDTVRPGDVVVVLTGDVLPVDGRLITAGSFDESALTGEAVPVDRAAGEAVRSGVVNAGAAAELMATATERDSSYAGVLRLAAEALADAAPVVRLADRIAAVFLPVAAGLAGLAWLLTGDPVRAVAVLVTATPCPLLLAVPVAITAGMSRASRSGVVVRDGRALELLGGVRVAVLDKTGTVTTGRPMITDVLVAPGVAVGTALGWAAAVEQLSSHPLAGAVVRAAAGAGLRPAPALQVTEEPGRGVSGLVDGHRVTVGRPGGADAQLSGWAAGAVRRARLDAATLIWITVDGGPVAALLARDRVRPGAARTLRRLRAAGLRRLVLLTGDRADNAAEAAVLLGLDDLQAQASPADKVARVRDERAYGSTVMVGDGLNDGPALAAADVGVALGRRGPTAAVRLADAVILDDRIDRLADAVEVARRARRIALQSAGAGMGLSLVAMGAAAGGWLVPVFGAVVQEVIDVAVIVNALRVLLPVRRLRPSARAELALHRFSAEHQQLLPVRQAVRQAADALSDGITPEAAAAVREAGRLATDVLLPHEHAEEAELYPLIADLLGTPEGTTTMSRGHNEIDRLVARLSRHLTEPGAIRPDQVDDLRATLYGLDAVLTLHFAQEEEGYFSLAEVNEPHPA